MDPTISRFNGKSSWRRQLVIRALTVGTFPVLYATLGLPRIVKRALARGADVHAPYGCTFDQTVSLFVPCGIFLLAVLIAGVLNIGAQPLCRGRLRRSRAVLRLDPAALARLPPPPGNGFCHLSGTATVKAVTPVTVLRISEKAL